MKARKFIAVVAVVAMLLGAGAYADEHGVAWDALTAEQQQVLNRFAENWDTLAPERQLRLSRGAERWADMTPLQREQAQR